MSDEQVLIRLEGVSKKFCRSFKRSMFYAGTDLAQSLVGAPPRGNTLRKKEFWALEDVSFEVRRGECLGLIGANGAGKSTLLKVLNGIMQPDRGRVTMRGRVCALIELGAGFHPLLTGRENIYINGAVLGLSKAEIARKVDEIIAFAELEDAIDTPVKYYSSGMYVRLGFAIAAQMEPDVLLLDEILAVGDPGFRAKCYDAIYGILRNAAVIFVSHAMAHVSRMCGNVVLLDKGKACRFQNTGEGIVAYLDSVDRSALVGEMQYSNGQAEIQGIRVNGAAAGETVVLGEPLDVSFDLSLAPEVQRVTVMVLVVARSQQAVAAARSGDGGIANTGGRQRITLHVPALCLSPERYALAIAVFDAARLNQLLWYHNVCPFRVEGEATYVAPTTLLGNWTVEPVG